MDKMNNRLQFVHHNELFGTREEAKAYLSQQFLSIDRPALFAEPMVLKYGDDADPNILLAIGSVGDGVTNSTKNRVFFIDFAHLEESINEIKEGISGDTESIESIKKVIDNIIQSSGLNLDGTYNVNVDDEILKYADSIYKANELLSAAILDESNRAKSEEAKLTIVPKISDTVDIVADKTETGTNLSANVKLVDNKTINGNNWSNIIISDENGLFANVDVKYESDKLIVTVNGNITEYNLPKEKYVKGGIYDKKSESIVLTFSDDTELSIDMVDLIEEWGVEDIQKSPIMLKKEHVVFEEGVHNQSKWRDILSADVRIKDDSNNILEKVLISKEDDTYGLYVNGSASNITCMVDGEITNVQDALNNIKCDVSDNDNNIIISRIDGLYATVSLNYDKATNTLLFDDGIHDTKSIKLSETSVLERAYYELGYLVLVFRLSDGNINEVRIPISDILKDFQFDNANHTVTLARKVENGQYYMYADVNVSSNKENILEVSNHELYVRGNASNIIYNNTTVADELNKLNSPVGTDGSIRDIVYKESVARKAEDEKLSSKIDDVEKAYVAANTDIVNTINSIKLVPCADNDLCYDLQVNEVSKGKITIPKDQFLKDVVYDKDSDSLIFTFVTTDGEKITKVDISELGDTYLAGNGIELNDRTFSLRLNPNSEFASVGSNGLLINGIKEELGKKADTSTVENQLSSLNNRIDLVSANSQIIPKETRSAKLSLSSTRELEAVVKLDLSANNIIRLTDNGLLSTAELYYDNLSGKLIFNNGITQKEYVIAQQSLVTDVKYNEDGQLVLVITKIDGSVEEVVVVFDRIIGGNSGNSPVTIHVDEQPNVKVITATLSVSNDKNNLIIADDGSLFASKVASDHICTYRGNEITVQEAIGRIATEIDNASGGGSVPSEELEQLKKQVADLETTVNELKSTLDALMATPLIDFGTYDN